MKKHTEKTPIDDLFARKLGNMSLPPSPDGFERLQAKMGYSKPEARIVIWRNPTMQRYMAIAACFLLVCMFGWLYWPTDQMTMPIAAKQPALSSPQKSLQEPGEIGLSTSMSAAKTPDLQNRKQTIEQQPVHSKLSGTAQANTNSKSFKRAKVLTISTASGSELAVVPAKKTEEKVEGAVTMPDVAIPVNRPTEQLAENTSTVKPVPATERGLVVTISEPEALVAARQAVKTDADEKSAVATNDKPEKGTKGNSLWQQVKRIKQGDVFARGNNSDVETSLIGRAYNGLKHNFDKDKSAKQ